MFVQENKKQKTSCQPARGIVYSTDVYPLLVVHDVMALHGYFTDSLNLQFPIESWSNICENSREPESKEFIPLNFFLSYVHDVTPQVDHKPRNSSRLLGGG